MLFEPGLIGQLHRGGVVYPRIVKVGILRGRMVAPDGHVAYVVDGHAGFLSQLRHGAIVIKPGHSGEVARIEIGRVSLGNESIGVGPDSPRPAL